MTTTPLRPYIREIETLIDQGHIDEAIAHSRHILTIMPKNLEAYRMLGKAFLENQRYGDASDLFLRVLSAVPDDFVAHVGMSIIREDEGHEDAAIWHMERAFEVQPYNSAIQDELRRLYGRRDGIEPPKVRLTRGALARMYARGDLYQQAMGELRSALLEDPQRTDLQVLLARMYYLSGQKVEAVEVCSKLLKKLPNCLEANRIIAAILPETERKDEAPAYKNRVAALDPYLGQASPRAADAEEVPEQTVIVERYDMSLGQPISEAGQPTWASSLGVSIEPFGAPKDSLPDWLTQPENVEGEIAVEEDSEADLSLDEPRPINPEISDDDDSAVERPDEAELPDWLQEAGWEVSKREGSESPDFLEMDEEEVGDGVEDDLPQGEIPDWLRDMAPPGTIADEETQGIGGEEEVVFPWMNDTAEESQKETPEETQPEDIESWMPGGNGDERLADDIPDRSSDSERAEGEPQEEDAQTEAQSDFELPDWLADIETTSKPTTEMMPGWLADTQTAAGAESEQDFELPDWLAGVQPAVDESEDGPMIEDMRSSPGEAETVDEAFETGLSMEAPSEAALEDEAGDELPDWLAAMEKPDKLIGESAEEDELEAELEAEFEAALEDEAGDELPAWLAEMEKPDELIGESAEEDVELEAEFEAALEDEAGDELPDWLEEMEKPGEPKEEPAEEDVELEAELEAEFEAALEDEAGDELPDWLAEMEKSDEPKEEPAEEDVELEADLEAEFVAALEDVPDDELPDWLAEMELPGEIRQEKAPWEEDLERDQTADLPDWLEDVGTAEGLKEDLLSEKEPFETQEEGEPVPEAAEQELSDTQPVKIQDETSAPSAEIEDQQSAEDQQAAVDQQSAEELQSAEDQQVEIDQVEEEIPASELVDDDAAMAWLEGLAAKHGVPEEELITRAEDRPEQMPDWMSEREPEGEPVELQKDEVVVEEEQVESVVEEPPAAISEDEEMVIEEQIFDEELETTAELEAEEAGPPIELPDWLLEIDTEVEEIGEAAEVDEDIDIEEYEISPAPVQSVPASEAEDYRALTGLDTEDEDEAMAWLEGLAAKHGVPEEELITRPEERPADTPQWIQEIQEDEAPAAEEPEPEIVEPGAGETVSEWQAEEEPPAGIQEMDSEPVQIETEEAVQEVAPAEEQPEETEQVEAAGEQVPAWLQEMVKEDARESGTPDWLEDVEEEALSEAPEAPESSSEIPAWLKEAEATLLGESVPETEEEAEPSEVQVSEPVLEDRDDDWISEVEEAAISQTAEEAPETVEPAELPGWLADLEAEQPEEEEAPWSPPQFDEAEAPPTLIPDKEPAPALDLNQASLIELEETPGIGFRLAQRIVEHRQTSGPFRDLNELGEVPGFNQELISELSGRLFVTVPAESAEEAPGEERPEGTGPGWELLTEARTSIETSPQESVERYTELITQELLLEEVVHDLQVHLETQPQDFGAWMTLGDALNRMDRPKEAMEAYIKAEQLLR